MHIGYSFELQKPYTEKNLAFTIVELLIVIVVIAILASISVVAYSGIRERAVVSKISSDLTTLEKAIFLARDARSQTLEQITGSSYSAGPCVNNGIDSSGCIDRYNAVLSAVQAASGVTVQGILDPWGRPYFVDENERSPGVQCSTDSIAAYANPYNGNNRYPDSERRIPMSGYAGC